MARSTKLPLMPRAMPVLWQDRRFNNWDVVAQLHLLAASLPGTVMAHWCRRKNFYLPSNAVNQHRPDPMDIADAQLSAHLSSQWRCCNSGKQQWRHTVGCSEPGISSFHKGLRFALEGVASGATHIIFARPRFRDCGRLCSGKRSITDLYEVDDACTQARPLQINGMAQTHTLASASAKPDEDWISLTLSQTTEIGFIAQANTLASSLQLALYMSVAAPIAPILRSRWSSDSGYVWNSL